jgi:ABC-type nitrate/sulfonate/bicarbonate transport system substrate-binding protein
VTRLRVVLDYLHPWPNAAGFYVARGRGWYQEAGLDVELRTHDYGWGDTLEYLARGEAELGVFPPNRLLVRRERAEPLVAVAAVNHEGLESVQVAAARGITRPGELEGRRIGFAFTARGRAMVRAVVQADGGDPDRVTLVDTGLTELTPEFLVTSGLDATFGGYWAWDALTQSRAAEETAVWPIGSLGVPRFHSYVLGINEQLLATSADALRTFLEVTAYGFLTAAAEQDAAVDDLERILPYVPRWRLARSLELVAPTWTDGGAWGQLRPELFGEYADLLAAHGVLNDPRAWTSAITNRFLPASPILSGPRGTGAPGQPVMRGRSGSALHSVSEPS